VFPRQTISAAPGTKLAFPGDVTMTDTEMSRAAVESLTLLGGVALAAGVVMLLWVRRRRFYRRNAYGSETFQGYGDTLGKRTVERLASIAGGIFVATGALLLFALLILPHLPST